MSKSKKLQKQIESKLDKLHKLLDKVDDARVINSDDDETWDSGTLYDLMDKLQKALQLLEDKLSTTQKDEFGNPLILETGLCSLVDEYFEEEDEDDDF